MKQTPYLLNTILALLVAVAAGAMLLVGIFQPAAVLPPINIPNLVLVSLAALLAEHFLSPFNRRCYICIPVFSALTFGLLPLAAGLVAVAEVWKLALAGCVVFTAVTWLFSSMTERMSTGHHTKLAALAGALGIYLASQCFAGIFL